jgi:putative membrane protein
LNLARIEVQTASGSSGAEMTLEGLLEFETIRDYLYTRMRGSHDRSSASLRAPAAGVGADAAAMQEVAHSLREVAAELRAVREALDGRERGELP